MKSGHLSAINTMFDTTGLGKLVRGQSMQTIATALESHGKIKKMLRYEEDQEGCKTKTAQYIRFKNDTVVLYILFNEQMQIQQIHTGKAVEQPFYILKGYKGLAEVTDLSTSFVSRDGVKLGASISFSDTSKKLPVVILVHGSGPNDRDETMGPNKCFRDLAQGLSQKGFAVFRYDKRTFAHTYDMKPRSDSMTIYTETMNDAVDAVRHIKTYTFIDTTRVYLVGHSQGAMCAPKIAELEPRLKAIVMMAGPTRSIVDIIPEQIEYLAGLDDSISTAEQMNITAVKWMADKIKHPDAKAATMPLMGANLYYWKSFMDYNQVATAQSLKLPILIMNGERDYQVRMTEFDGWKQALKDHPNVSFKSYPELTHLFIEGSSKPGPADYDIPRHIPQAVIDDIADFLKLH
ncbi:MAG: alpha/beta fold hydrolase [Bacteroidetes bacterium]|nr:alpha/beta fold hydrolase [Bacteroidota bacterium]